MSYCYSHDEETFHGDFPTYEAAVEAGRSDAGDRPVFVGEAVPPTQPEDWWNAEDWLEHVSVQDEYSGDWAEDWDNSTKEQREELEREVRAVMAAWLDRHDLRPKFFNVSGVKLVPASPANEGATT